MTAASNTFYDVFIFAFLTHYLNLSLVLVQPRKTRPFITERLLMGRKESNQKLITGLIVLSADNICKQIGPSSGPTKHQA